VCASFILLESSQIAYLTSPCFYDIILRVENREMAVSQSLPVSRWGRHICSRFWKTILCVARPSGSLSYEHCPSYPTLSQTGEWRHPKPDFDKLRVLATAKNTATFRNCQVARTLPWPCTLLVATPCSRFTRKTCCLSAQLGKGEGHLNRFTTSTSVDGNPRKEKTKWFKHNSQISSTWSMRKRRQTGTRYTSRSRLQASRFRGSRARICR